MQILEIVIYGRNGKRRVVEFKPGAVNIITGQSRRGKSAVLEIIDYCLGSSKCNVPAGVIRELTSWYALRLQIAETQFFVARANPSSDAQSTNVAFVLEGADVGSPEVEPAQGNTTIDAVEALLAERLRIGDFKNATPSGQTRDNLSITLRHSLAYCVQSQDEIASKQLIFHGQADNWVKQAIKDSLPYFLGAVPEDEFALHQQLSELKRQLKIVERRLQEAQLIGTQGFARGSQLASEAHSVGLVADQVNAKTEQELIAILQAALSWSPQVNSAPRFAELNDNETQVRKAESEIEELDQTIFTAQNFLRDAGGFETEAKEQELRLTSIGLYDLAVADHSICPFCEAKHQQPLVDLEGIRKSIQTLNSGLQTVSKTRPKLQKHVESLKEKRATLVEQRDVSLTRIRGIQSAIREFRESRDRLVQSGVVLGKIRLWLEVISAPDENTSLASRASELKARIATIEKQIDPEEREQRLRSILNRIATRMTEESKQLRLEHSADPIHLDLRDLTVVIDKPERPITLRQTGSGENWVGYHLVTLLALHAHFIGQGRPVPRFLILDQPSQIYFPPDVDFSKETPNLKDADREALSRLYSRMFTFVREVAPNFQIIVLDHARLQQQEFTDSIREEWRGDMALIPADWIE